MSAPVAARQLAPDVLRGIALLLILAVNVEFLSQTVYDGYERPQFGGLADQVARWLVLAFCQLNAYLLFSLLFGLGLALQLERAGGDEAGLRRRYRRRLGGLAIIGVLHATLLFVGDILVSYALLGLLLYRFRSASTRRVLRTAGWLLAGAVAVSALIGLAIAADPGASQGTGVGGDADAVRRTFAEGSFLAVAAQRVEDLAVFYVVTPLLQWPSAFAMFLVGLALGRSGVLADPAAHRGQLRRGLRWTLPAGLLGGVASATLQVVPAFSGWGDGLSLALRTATAPALALAYVAAIALVLARRHEGRLGASLARERQLGRMSLTLYVGESLVASLIFNGYGLGLFGELGPAAGLGVALAIWLAGIPFAQLWFRRFAQGPLEWLLRSWTYGRRLPLRRATPQNSSA